jgi:hypothetical protein
MRVSSEIFRIFLTPFRTSHVSRGYRVPAMRAAKATGRKGRKSDDWGFCRFVSGKRNALLAIGVGGLIVGTLDLTQAFILFGVRVPLVIAAGLLGRQALHGGVATYALGVLLHFFIASSATAVYYLASRSLTFLKEHPLVCGFFYGIAVELVMSYIVLPLSALHDRGPYELHDVLQGLIVHMVVVGLPISFSVRRFAK